MCARLACLLLLAVGIAAATSVVYGADGRWKLGGDGSCYFDPNDSGPDQCSPPTAPAGRWKLGGDGSCFWDPNDSGPDQCTPAAEAIAEAVPDSLDALLGSLPSSTVIALPNPSRDAAQSFAVTALPDAAYAR
jgi:hypothetical protein